MPIAFWIEALAFFPYGLPSGLATRPEFLLLRLQR